MKLRIKNNAIRYRLTRSDVSQLAEKGLIEDHVHFGAGTLSYNVKTTTGDKLTSAFENNTVTLFVPISFVNELQDTDKVGFEGIDNGVFLLLEKDFICMDKTAEDQSDNYPHPLADKYYEQKQ
jgi:hypothetical protein